MEIVNIKNAFGIKNEWFFICSVIQIYMYTVLWVSSQTFKVQMSQELSILYANWLIIPVSLESILKHPIALITTFGSSDWFSTVITSSIIPFWRNNNLFVPVLVSNNNNDNIQIKYSPLTWSVHNKQE